MKKIGFIGAYDKTDLMINIAKVLTVLEKKVLIIDTSLMQKTKYVVPSISPTTSYITNFQNFDIAVGLYSFKDIEEYLGEESFNEDKYDYVLIDVDNSDMVDEFDLYNAKENFYVTGLDMYSVKKGVEIISGIKENLEVIKVIFAQNIYEEDCDEYINFLALGKKIVWKNEKAFFEITESDNEAIIHNQKNAVVSFSGLSSVYKDSMQYMIDKILVNDIYKGNLKKVIRQV